MDEKRMIEVLSRILDERSAVDLKTHNTHHAFVEELIMARKRRQERWEKIRAHVYGWSIVTLLGGFGATLWNWISNIFPKHGGS